MIRKIDISGIDQRKLLGINDQHLKKIAAEFAAQISIRGSEIILKGASAELEQIERLFTELILLFNKHAQVTSHDIDTVLAVLKKNQQSKLPIDFNKESSETILFTKEAAIRPKTKRQAAYCRAANNNDLVFAIGPAGTGKTYLAVAIAVAHLRDKHVSRIILTRPAVEAGERLGYLPGDLLEKVDPYLRPLYDALMDMLPSEKLQRYLDSRIIEVMPLAYMRGRTLNNSFVILDEAQNTSINQMKMLLTRIGINSKAIVTGDITQIDLAPGMESGLIQVQGVLKEVSGVEFVYLNENDVVRHKLVRDIIQAYEAFDNRE